MFRLQVLFGELPAYFAWNGGTRDMTELLAVVSGVSRSEGAELSTVAASGTSNRVPASRLE